MQSVFTMQFNFYCMQESERVRPGGRYIDHTESDRVFTVILNYGWDIFVQYDNGYACDIPAENNSQWSTPENYTYIGQTEELTLHDDACDEDKHDFGSRTLSEAANLDIDPKTTCEKCGLSIDYLQHYLFDTYTESLDFTCPICNDKYPGQAGNWRVHGEEKVCNTCWRTRYIPEVDAERDEFDTHFIVCTNGFWNLLPNTTVEPEMTGNDCGWIARPTLNTVTEYFTLQDDRMGNGIPIHREPFSDTGCSNCNSGFTDLAFTWLPVDTILGQALVTVLSDEPEGDGTNAVVFDDGEVERVLTPEEIEAVRSLCSQDIDLPTKD